MPKIEFVSYDGEYPNLCRGVLTLLIDGKEYRFGHDYCKFESYKTDGNYESFWSSGGCCGFDDDWNEMVMDGEWRIDKEELPDGLKEYSEEIGEIFNANVPWGCCGGCI